MRLVCVAHGTRSGEGNAIAESLTRLAGEAAGVGSTVAYVELQAPSLPTVLSGGTESVVVPLLLSRGYHLAVDLPSAVLSATSAVTLAPALGPDARLAEAQVARLLEVGAMPGRPVVLVGAGSRSSLGAVDLAGAADLLSGLWGGPVRVATVTDENLLDVVRPGDAVSPYLLAPGFFSRRVAELARSAGASVVAEVIGDHPAVVGLVADRFRAAAAVGV